MTAPARGLSRAEAEVIARTCHAANAELQKAHGDEAPSLPWEAEGEEVRQRAITGVERALAGVTAEELHASWCRDMAAEGWRRGAVKDREAKTHPALVPYGDLPGHQRVKDAVFIAIVQAMAGTVPEVAAAPPGQAAYEARIMSVSARMGEAPEDTAPPWTELPDAYRAEWETAARAAIDALRAGDSASAESIREALAAREPQPALLADRNELREALRQIALGIAGDPPVAADKALTASRDRRDEWEPAMAGPQPAPGPADLRDLLAEVLREVELGTLRLDTPVAAERTRACVAGYRRRGGLPW